MRVLNEGNRSAFTLLYHGSSDGKVHGRQRHMANKGTHHRVWDWGRGRVPFHPRKAFIVTLSEASFSVHCCLGAQLSPTSFGSVTVFVDNADSLRAFRLWQTAAAAAGGWGRGRSAFRVPTALPHPFTAGKGTSVSSLQDQLSHITKRLARRPIAFGVM